MAAFEEAFAARHGVAHALAVTSCTAGLHLGLAALGVGPGDEVIVPAFTWVATANAVLYCGATPVFADVDRTTFNIEASAVAGTVSPRTRAIVPVHLFGLCADIDAIRAALPDGVAIVEDAACAAGSRAGQAAAGSLGAAAAFSFHPRKSITTGEGGMVTTNDADVAARVHRLRDHGTSISDAARHEGPRPYLMPDVDELGFNYRMTDVQAAIGLVQLGKLDRFIAERQRWAEFYEAELAGVEWLRTPQPPADGQHAWQAYVTYVDPATAPLARNEVMDRLQARGIATRPGTHAVHMLGYYRDRFGLASQAYPAARDCEHNSMAIPLHNRMSAEDYAYVVDCIRQIA